MKNKIVTTVFCTLLAAGMILGLMIPDAEVSRTERRKLAAFPLFSWKAVESGKFMEGLDNYITDNFPFRDTLRSTSAFVRLRLMGQRDISGVFEYQGGIYGLENGGNEASPERLAKKISLISEKLADSEIFACVIPEKSAFIKESGYPLPDYESDVTRFKQALPDSIKYIDIWNAIDAEDYYRTDLHWRQERLSPVLRALGEKMGFDADISGMERRSYFPFYGGYYSRLGLSGEADELVYLVSPATDSAEVCSIEAEMNGVYDEQALYGLDSYDVYLSGAKSVITITQPLAQNGRKLVIFRDSFASSLAPLLLEAQPAYSEITLVDLRYISPQLLEEYISLGEYDQALFIYSTMIVENSALIK